MVKFVKEVEGVKGVESVPLLLLDDLVNGRIVWKIIDSVLNLMKVFWDVDFDWCLGILEHWGSVGFWSSLKLLNREFIGLIGEERS